MSAESIIKEEGNGIDSFKGEGRKEDKRESERIAWREGSPHVCGPAGSYLWERGLGMLLQGTKEHGVWVLV